MIRLHTIVLLGALFTGGTGCASHGPDDATRPSTSPSATAAGTGGAAAPVEAPGTFDNSTGIAGGGGADVGQPGPHASGSITEINGSGVRAEAEHTVEAFDQIAIHAFAEVHVSFGAQRVVVSGDDNVVPHIITRVDAGELHIDMESNLAITYNLPLRIDVSMPVLTQVHARFSGKLTITDVKAAELKLDCYATDAAASGQVDRLTVSNDLGGMIDARALLAKVVTVTSGAGGTTLLTASEAIDGELEGGAELHVFGQPTMRNVTASSGATISYE
jgi:hypothetical protein